MNILENILSELQKLNKNFEELNSKLSPNENFELAKSISNDLAAKRQQTRLQQMLSQIKPTPPKDQE